MNNYKRNYKSNRNYFNNFPVIHKTKKGKEYYLSLFEQKFKLWLIIVIKMLSEKKNSEIKFNKNESINKEIIESFLKEYDYEKNSNNENQNIKNQLNIKIENIKLNKIVANDFNIEFNIIITEEIKVFFLKKYIKIKVIGKVYYNKFPEFIFRVKQYKISLIDEINKYNNNEKELSYYKNSEENNKNKGKKEENLNNSNLNSNLEKEKKNKNEVDNKDIKDETIDEDKEKKNDNIVLNIKNNHDDAHQFIIGMCPNYSIPNKKFKNLLMDLYLLVDNNNINKIKMKGPQEEIRDIFIELKEILKNEKEK